MCIPREPVPSKTRRLLKHRTVLTDNAWVAKHHRNRVLFARPAEACRAPHAGCVVVLLLASVFFPRSGSGQQIPKAQRHYTLGLNLEKESNLAEAASEFTKAIQINPEFAAAYYELGRVEKLRGDSKAAIRTLTQLTEFDPANNKARLLLARIYSDSGDVDRALALYSQALKQAPADPEIYYEIGVIAFNEKDYSQAVIMLKKALSLDPAMNDARRMLISAFEDTGNTKEAMERLHEAILLEPNSPDLVTNLGELDIKAGRLAQAESEFRKALSLHSDFVPAQLGLGTVYRLSGRLPAAVAQFSKIIHEIPGEARPYLERGRAEYAGGNINAARSDFETYSRMAADRPEGNYFLGILDCAAGDYASAVSRLKLALASDPSLADAYFLLGQAYFHLDRWKEAEEALRHCLSLDGSNEAAKKLLGELLEKGAGTGAAGKQPFRNK